MAGDTVITVIGNITGDPELRFTPSGAAVANFTVASTPRQFDRQSNEWKDGETLFMRCSVWREAAENVAESLVRGSRVIVSGRLKSRSWDDKETGKKQSRIEVVATDVTFLDGPNGGDGGSSSSQSSSRSSKSTSQDVVIEDIDDKPIDLSEIPF